MAAPVNVQAALDLAGQGINAQSFRFGVTTMESDKYICVKDTGADGAPQVVVIDMHNGNNVTKRPMKAEATLMNPAENIMALKAVAEGQTGQFVQVFNLDTKAKLGVYQSPENIVFWKWVTTRILAFVTQTDVYHWNLDVANSTPEKMFTRAGKLAEAGSQIISYATNAAMTWCLLTGISTQDQGKTIDGNMQLYSVEKKQQQLLEGHAGSFGNLRVTDDGIVAGLFAFSERKVGTQQTKLHIMDISKATPFKIAVEVPMPTEAPGDFAVALHLSEKHGVVYMVTKAGFLLLFDVATGTMLLRSRVSQESIFISTYSQKTGGCLFINRSGKVMSAAVNEQTMVGYIMNQLVQLPNRQEIAFTLARRFSMAGADELFQQEFARRFASGDYKGAATIAGQCKSGMLRTPQIIQQFKSVQAPPGQTSPILHYFSTLLEYGKLNAQESVELCQPVVQQGRRELVEKWLKEDKLECTEQLGDIVRPMDTKFALSIYIRAAVHDKVIQCFVENGQIDQVVAYAKKVGYQADYTQLLQNMVLSNPEGATNFAKALVEGKDGHPLIDLNAVVKIFMDQNKLQETTSILLEALKANRPDQAALQTQLLAMNLQQAPKVAEAILQMNLFTHYDRSYIGQLCEKAGLMQWAMEHYTDAASLKRVMLHAHTMTPEFLINYFSKLAPETALECLHDLMRHNRQNLNVAVQISIKYHGAIGAMKIVEMFESFGSNEGVFYFLGAILSSSTDPDVHFSYIKAASRCGNMQEVERVCRESSCYNPVAVKDFLKEAKLPDPRPLIYVCDLHDHVNELTEYLYKNSLMKYIEVYVVKVNPVKCPQVVGSLIDLDCSEDFIKNLLQNVRAACPIEPLVAEVEKRNRLRVLLPWLEARVSEGNQDPHLHNAMAMILIDTNRDPETFLKNNAFYDSATVGKYCEDRDPHLAYTAYKRAWGSCDEALVDVTNRNGLFRLQARYLVERQSPELWELVLQSDNKHRRNVIDQVVSTALPECSNADEVSATVKAFISADLPNELIELLEKIVLHKSADFSKNKNLQNLLILTAIKADKTRVMDYINRLDNYDGSEIAKIALGEPYCLFEEAFLIYKKANLNSEAMEVLLTNIESIERAQEYAARCNESRVWYKLGRAQLEHGNVPEAIDSYLKAEDAADYAEVIRRAKIEDNYDELVKYLTMARNKAKDQLIDTELVYSYAKADRLGDMEEFMSGTNTANVQAVGDRLFDEGIYKAAKSLFQSISNNAKLAACHVHLGEYPQAVEAAKKANNPKVWKDVNTACIKAEQFKCAEIAAMNIVVHPDHLEEVTSQYEASGNFEELIALLESALGNERAHVGMFTELAILYAKYKPAKLMDFVKLNTQKLNIPKLVQACERHYLWSEAVFLLTHYDEFDQAASMMMAHSPTAFSHDQFLMVMQKVANAEIYYRALSFYVDENPMQVNALLNTVASKVDHARVVAQMRKADQLPLILPYMKSIQQHNIAAVNDAINDVYTDGEQFEELRQSIAEFDNFDQIALAQRLEKHELMEMRRIAALVYQKNKRYKQSIELSKQDMVYKDAMETACESGNTELAESLLKFFVENGHKECFAACLYTCYDLITPDVALELAWRNGLTDYCMPYLIQVMREFTGRVNALDKKTTKKEEEEEKNKSASNDYVPDYMVPNMMMPGLGQLAIGGPQHMPQPGFGQPGMMPQAQNPMMMMTPGHF
eukprot:TRINITY_DN1496_c0_g1_i1.p1 TRINITY_DN1496_c0_g1~~TRINITY_DN1496_c0_g1_i1.p1  ORF type:complete len:1703 (+),score=387.00 TRINITY_DN1496_c0_g1_i1:58-5166(+)